MVHPISVFCLLTWTAFSSRSAQLHPSPMGMSGVLSKVTGDREGKRGGMARALDMAGTSVERREVGIRHSTAHMVR